MRKSLAPAALLIFRKERPASSEQARRSNRLTLLKLTSYLCQRPSCGPRWWPTRSPHSRVGVQLVLGLLPVRARACLMR
jgi:hypothetical protein